MVYHVTFFTHHIVYCDYISDTDDYETQFYDDLTIPELKAYINSNISSSGALMREAEITYVRDNRQVVANFYEAIIAWVDREVPLAFKYLDAIQNDTIKTLEYIELAYSVNIRYNNGQVAYKERAGHPLNVTDTADNLAKDLLNLEYKLINGLTQAIDTEIQKGLTFWATLHQNVSQTVV